MEQKIESRLCYGRRKYIEINEALNRKDLEAVNGVLQEIRLKFGALDSGEVHDIPLIVVQIADWVISYINGREIDLDRVFEGLINCINSHLDEYVFNNPTNRKKYNSFVSSGVIFSQLISRVLQGEIPVNPLEVEAVNFGRMLLLREGLTKWIDKACFDYQAEKKKQAEIQELKKYANVRGGKLSDRIEPIIEMLIDTLVERLENNAEELDITELTKLLNTVLVPAAKMRKELNDGTEINITKNNVFAQIMKITSTPEEKERLIETSRATLEAEYKLL